MRDACVAVHWKVDKHIYVYTQGKMSAKTCRYKQCIKSRKFNKTTEYETKSESGNSELSKQQRLHVESAGLVAPLYC